MEYKQFSKVESYVYGNFQYGVEINIGGDTGSLLLSDELKEVVYECSKKIQNIILEELIKKDPESLEVAKEREKMIIDCFDGREIFVKKIPNGYCSQSCCKHLPWFEVTTSKGIITIGWRKRVICISWDNSIINSGAEELFPNEDVTKFDKTIHAWGYDKAKAYIKVLLSS
jgi:hypothetical protein